MFIYEQNEPCLCKCLAWEPELLNRLAMFAARWLCHGLLISKPRLSSGILVDELSTVCCLGVGTIVVCRGVGCRLAAGQTLEDGDSVEDN